MGLTFLSLKHFKNVPLPLGLRTFSESSVIQGIVLLYVKCICILWKLLVFFFFDFQQFGYDVSQQWFLIVYLFCDLLHFLNL